MTSVIISNIIQGAVVFAAIVAGLVWAIASQHDDQFTRIRARPSSDDAEGLPLHEASREMTGVFQGIGLVNHQQTGTGTAQKRLLKSFRAASAPPASEAATHVREGVSAWARPPR